MFDQYAAMRTQKGTKTTVHIQIQEQLQRKMAISNKNVYIIKLAGLTTCGSSVAVATASQMTPLRTTNAVR